jgi:DNA (cytosine-5)-methyltransferase 1
VGTTQKLPTLLSLCSGYGGIERGINLAGVEHRVVTYVEIEAFAISNLVSKMESGQLDAAPVWTNLKTLPVEPFRRRVDIITGGYPCQPFSVAGKRGAEKDERHLWPYIREIIRAVRPVRCFFENVEGHINLGLREVISDLESLGYKTAWGIFSAAEVGAPHQRKRVFIMADSDNGLNQFSHKEIRTGGDAFINGGKFMADSQSQFRKRSQPKRIVGRKSKEKVRNRSSVVADTDSTRSKTRVSRQKRSDQERYARISDNCGGKPSRGEIGMSWPSESGILRVVDGCPDRVDRIRLLGNGVVPKTAAKAWAVLSEELA